MTDPVARTPVLILAFNRPDRLKTILTAVRAAGVRRLYVSLDGPRPGNERDHEQCAAVRRLVAEQDWAEHIEVNASDHNRGCGIGVSEGITWFFSRVEEGIILEDDCLPTADFFRFVGELLPRYRDDERVMMITGSDFSGLAPRRPANSPSYNYRFVHYPCVWGWASWQRAWRHYDITMPTWPEAKAAGLLDTLFRDPRWQRYWERKLDGMHRGRRDTWDYAWMYICMSRHAVTITPVGNQITNIGDGPEATHTHDNNPLLHCPSSPMVFPLRHPPFMSVDTEYDRLLRQLLCPSPWRRRWRRWSHLFTGSGRT